MKFRGLTKRLMKVRREQRIWTGNAIKYLAEVHGDE